MSHPKNPLNHSRSRPFVRIIEQPSKSLRYRYVVEGRPGTISGISSTPEQRIPFTIEIVGYQGLVVVVVSCVTQKPPYKPHPHNLSGPNCKDGYCTLRTEVTAENSRISFPKLAVQCVKRKDVEHALRIRQQKNIDPFLTGFEHCSDFRSIDLNVVRLCVQVFLKGDGKDLGVLSPVVSEPIYNKKTIPDPLIYRLSQCNSCVNGNVNGREEEEIILLCTRVVKEDIKIRFFEVHSDWEDYGTFKSNAVYNQTAICFKPPKYHNQNITEAVRVSLQLVRVSDGVISPPVEFEYLPLDTEPGALAKKRKLYDMDTFAPLLHPSSLNYAEPLLPYPQFPPSRDSTPSDSTTSPPIYFVSDTTRQTPSSNPEFSISPLTSFLNNIDEAQEPTPESPFTSFLNSISAREGPSTNFPFLNDIDACVGTSRQNVPNYNITNDFGVNSDVNIENAGVVRDMLPNYQEDELPVIHVSSGDLEMRNVEKLSESLQDHLVL